MSQIATTFQVQGMSCGHCVGAVRSAFEALPGVRSVEVDLDRGAAVVTSTSPLDVEAVRAAVEDAGYELAP